MEHCPGATVTTLPSCCLMACALFDYLTGCSLCFLSCWPRSLCYHSYMVDQVVGWRDRCEDAVREFQAYIQGGDTAEATAMKEGTTPPPSAGLVLASVGRRLGFEASLVERLGRLVCEGALIEVVDVHKEVCLFVFWCLRFLFVCIDSTNRLTNENTAQSYGVCVSVFDFSIRLDSANRLTKGNTSVSRRRIRFIVKEFFRQGGQEAWGYVCVFLVWRRPNQPADQ